MSTLEISAPPIITHGAEDTYNAFDRIYPQAILDGLSELALEASRRVAPDIQDSDIWASGFSGGYSPEDLATTDTAKLTRRSSATHMEAVDEEWIGFEGDDSNEANVAEREVHALRQEKQQIAKSLHGQDLLTPSEQAEARARIAKLDEQINSIRAAQRAAGNLPIYYATPASGIADRISEDNPLSYIGDIPGVGHLALYDGRAITADPDLHVTKKSNWQVRIAGLGVHVMRHALAVVRLEFVDA